MPMPPCSQGKSRRAGSGQEGEAQDIPVSHLIVPLAIDTLYAVGPLSLLNEWMQDHLRVRGGQVSDAAPVSGHPEGNAASVLGSAGV